MYLDYDGILDYVHAGGNASMSAKRWKRTCYYIGEEDPPPLTSIDADVTGYYFGSAIINPDILFFDKAIAYSECVLQAKCTGSNGNLVDRNKAVQVEDGSLSASSGTSGSGFSWTPSGTGSTATMIGSFPASGATNFEELAGYFEEGYVSLIQSGVLLWGHDELGYADAYGFVSL